MKAAHTWWWPAVLLVIGAALAWLWWDVPSQEPMADGEPSLSDSTVAEAADPAQNLAPGSRNTAEPAESNGLEPGQGAIELFLIGEGSRKPLADFELKLGLRPEDSGRTEVRSFRTDERGRLQLTQAAGTWVVTARVPATRTTGYFYDEVWWLFEEQQLETRELLVAEVGALRGLVVDEVGTPLADVRVVGTRPWNEDEEEPPDDLITRSTTTNTSGEFELTGLIGDFEIAAEAEDRLAIGIASGYLESGQILNDLRLVLAKTRSIRGRVLGPDGEPLPEVYVSAWLDWPGIGGTPAGPSVFAEIEGDEITDFRGEFELEDLPIHPMQLQLSHDAYGQVELELPPEQSYVEAKLGAEHERAWLVGEVRSADDEAIPWARFRLPPHGASKQSGMSTADGSFRVGPIFLLRDGAPLGNFPVVVWAKKHGLARMIVPQLQPGENRLDVRLPPEAEISGRLVDESQQPVSHAALLCESKMEFVPGMDVLRVVNRSHFRTNEQGEFRIRGLWPGEFRLSGPIGHVPETVAAPAGDVQLIVRHSGPDLRLQFDVRLADLEQVPDAVQVWLQHAGGTNLNYLRPKNGVFALERLHAGEYGFAVFVRGYVAWHQPRRDWSAGEHRLPVELHPARKLRLRTLTQDGRPLAGVAIDPRWNEGGAIGFASRGAVSSLPPNPVTDTNGWAYLSPLPATSFELRLTPPGGVTSSIPVDLSGEDEQELVLRL